MFAFHFSSEVQYYTLTGCVKLVPASRGSGFKQPRIDVFEQLSTTLAAIETGELNDMCS